MAAEVAMVPRLRTYDELWPYYVSEHRKPATRALHSYQQLLAPRTGDSTGRPA